MIKKILIYIGSISTLLGMYFHLEVVYFNFLDCERLSLIEYFFVLIAVITWLNISIFNLISIRVGEIAGIVTILVITILVIIIIVSNIIEIYKYGLA